jgi:gas vesicle protein
MLIDSLRNGDPFFQGMLLGAAVGMTMGLLAGYSYGRWGRWRRRHKAEWRGGNT